jgi:HPt (histidine-containing phosphotransfer) domain-containing protein
MSGPENAMDFSYLESFTAGDQGVIDEVLVLFRQQAEIWTSSLDADDPAWVDVVHTIKGSARGIGATALGDACARAEAQGSSGGLAEVLGALKGTVAAIAAYQARHSG